MTKRLLLWGFAGLMMAGCAPAAFAPVASPNPWADDYESLSAMTDYRSWGTYNVHDPSCRKLGDYYYMFSTDAIYKENRHAADSAGVPIGFIQMRRSRDLVDWEFLGWAFSEIPEEAVEWVRSNSGGQGATNVWAPYIIQYKEKYRLYYCVSAFARKTSYIGLAEAPSPEGPWTHVGCVVRSNDDTPMNAIDPSVIVDATDGRWFMHYGSYFGGLYCVELSPETGLAATPGDLGQLVARRANWAKDNLEAPEIMRHEPSGRYYLFASYDPLMTTYNVRVGRSERPDSAFTDFFGDALADTTNNFPILTAPYRFEGHPGWAGTAHCSVFDDGQGRYFMAHQGRLSPANLMMDLHVREMFFTPDGWPVVSPERYAGSQPRTFGEADLAGEWEIVRIRESQHVRGLEAGQVLWGEGELQEGECNVSTQLTLDAQGQLGQDDGAWSFDADKQLLTLTLGDETIGNLIVFAGHDWERETETVLFTGLDSRGRSVWGKRVR